MSVTSAGAPTLSVPRSSNEGKTRAAFTVAQATTWLTDMPNMMNFDMTFGKSTTPVVFEAQSAEREVAKRREMVWEIERVLNEDVARTSCMAAAHSAGSRM